MTYDIMSNDVMYLFIFCFSFYRLISVSYGCYQTEDGVWIAFSLLLYLNVHTHLTESDRSLALISWISFYFYYYRCDWIDGGH